VISRNEIDELQAIATYYRDRVALLRAKLYRGGIGSSARLQALERELDRAQKRLRDAQRRPGP
jgi:hypothetical protein